MFHSKEGLYFDRQENGSVRILKVDHECSDKGSFNIEWETTVDEGSWVSAVLCMTKFSERPNDWHKFLEHHQGKKDILI